MSSRRKVVKGIARRLRDIVYHLEGSSPGLEKSDVSGFVLYERVRFNSIEQSTFVPPLAFITIFPSAEKALELMAYRMELNKLLEKKDFVIKTIFRDAEGVTRIPKVIDERALTKIPLGLELET